MTISSPIPIVFAASETYFQHLCVVMISVLENNPHRCFHFYILTDTDRIESTEKILSLKEKYSHAQFTFVVVVDPRELCDLTLCINHISIHTYYRYLIPRLLPEHEKVLYLDGDVLVLGKLDALWEEDISNYYVAGVLDDYIQRVGYKTTIGFEPDELYVNAGVLLMNLKRMREDNIATALIETTKQLGTTISYQDQDVLNMVLRGKIKKVPCLYNFCTDTDLERKISKKEVVIAHFTGQAKPWTLQHRCKHRCCRHYFKYLRRSPYENLATKCSRLSYRLSSFAAKVFSIRQEETKIRVYIFFCNFSLQRKKGPHA